MLSRHPRNLDHSCFTRLSVLDAVCLWNRERVVVLRGYNSYGHLRQDAVDKSLVVGSLRSCPGPGLPMKTRHTHHHSLETQLSAWRTKALHLLNYLLNIFVDFRMCLDTELVRCQCRLTFFTHKAANQNGYVFIMCSPSTVVPWQLPCHGNMATDPLFQPHTRSQIISKHMFQKCFKFGLFCWLFVGVQVF